MPKLQNNIVCPHCRTIISLNQGINAIPTCYALLNIIEDRIKQKREECPRHEGHKADIICMEDKCKICLCCIVYGEHKNHKIERFGDFKEQVDKKIVEFERFIEQVGEWPDHIERIFLQECEELKAEISEKFDGLMKAVMQEKEVALKGIEQSFTEEIKKIRSASKENENVLKSVEEVKKMISDLKGEEFKASMFAVFDEDKTKELMYRPQEYEKDSVKDYCKKIFNAVCQDFDVQNSEVLVALKNYEDVKIKFPPFFKAPKIAIEQHGKGRDLFDFILKRQNSGQQQGAGGFCHENNPFAPKRGLFG